MNAVDIVISGNALNTQGFVGLLYTALNDGLSLNTQGFLWPCPAIWTNSELPITTVWTAFTGQTGSIEVCTD